MWTQVLLAMFLRRKKKLVDLKTWQYVTECLDNVMIAETWLWSLICNINYDNELKKLYCNILGH